MTRTLVVVLALLAGTIAAAAFSLWRWKAATADAIAALPLHEEAAPTTATLPPVVERYLRTVAGTNAGRIARARITSRGTFLVKQDPVAWGPFTATQVFTTNPPGFVWDANIRMAPGVSVLVRDMLRDGEGSMHGAVWGAITVTHPPSSSPELTSGTLHRYLAETIWFPTALQPGSGVTWTALSDSSARADLTVGRTTVSLDFFFGPDGLATRIFARGRYRDDAGGAVLVPWEVRLRRYEARSGLLIPIEAEVGWLPQGKWQPYWRGVITGAEYTWSNRLATWYAGGRARRTYGVLEGSPGRR